MRLEATRHIGLEDLSRAKSVAITKFEYHVISSRNADFVTLHAVGDRRTFPSPIQLIRSGRCSLLPNKPTNLGTSISTHQNVRNVKLDSPR